MSKTVFMGNSIILHNVKKFKNWTKTLLLKTCSDLLFCGSIFIDVTSQRFLHSLKSPNHINKFSSMYSKIWPPYLRQFLFILHNETYTNSSLLRL